MDNLALLLPLVFGLCACSEPSEKGPAREPATQSAPRPSDAGLEAAGDLGYGDDARLFSSPAEAIAEVLKGKPRVLGFGEFHKLTTSAPVRSALRRFADDIFDLLGPQSAHLILETWSVDPKCGKKGRTVTRKVESAIERPKETESEMQTLMRKAQSFGTAGHVLQFSCEEYASLLNKDGLDTEALLVSVSAKLGESASKAVSLSSDDKMVLVYGGATHNNLHPYPGLEAWSYAPALAKSVPGYVEIDLYVPELVEGDTLLAQEAWYPLLAEAREDKVILIRRDPSSYIVLMRKGLAQEAVELTDGQDDGQKTQKNQKGATKDTGTAN